MKDGRRINDILMKKNENLAIVILIKAKNKKWENQENNYGIVFT